MRTGEDCDAVLIFGALRLKALGTGRHFAAHATTAAQVGLSEATVKRKLRSLKKRQLIQQWGRFDKNGRRSTNETLPCWHEIWEDEYRKKTGRPSGRTLGESFQWSEFADLRFPSFFIPSPIAAIPREDLASLSKVVYGALANEEVERSREAVARALCLEGRSNASWNRRAAVLNQVTDAIRPLREANMIEIENYEGIWGPITFLPTDQWMNRSSRDKRRMDRLRPLFAKCSRFEIRTLQPTLFRLSKKNNTIFIEAAAGQYPQLLDADDNVLMEGFDFEFHCCGSFELETVRQDKSRQRRIFPGGLLSASELLLAHQVVRYPCRIDSPPEASLRLTSKWRAEGDLLILEIYPSFLAPAIRDVRRPRDYGDQFYHDHELVRKNGLPMNLMLADEGFDPNWMIQFEDGITVRWGQLTDAYSSELWDKYQTDSYGLTGWEAEKSAGVDLTPKLRQIVETRFEIRTAVSSSKAR
jgi:hypothetical protein